MKKTCAFILSAVLTMPAFATTDTNTVATETVAQDTETTLQDTVAQVENNVSDAYVKTSNPDIKFPRGMELGVGISATSGLNGFIGYNNKKFDSFWWKRLGIRFDFASTKPLQSFMNKRIDKFMGKDGIEINDEISIVDGSIKSNHIGALVDFYPFGDTWFLGGWRITGGYVFGNLNVDADLKGTVEGLPAGTVEFEFGGTKYRYLGNDVYGKAELDWDLHGPYVGTGFDLGIFRGFKLFLDAGVVFTSKAAELDLDVDVNNLQYNDGGGWKKLSEYGDYANKVSDFNARKNAELKDAQDELNKYKFFPIVKMGFMYRF